ncbi:MAG: hypothetical protein AABX38_05905 [Candidatus Micrarchaeota archaeon]
MSCLCDSAYLEKNMIASASDKLHNKKFIFLIAFFIFSILPNLSFADGLTSCSLNYIDIANSGMGAYIGVSFMLMVILLILAYLFGTMTQNANLLAFYKDELYHVLFSAILLVCISGIFYFSCVSLSAFLDFTLTQLGSSACYSGVEAPSTVASCYFSGIEVRLRTFVSQGIKQSLQNEMESTVMLMINNPITGSTYMPLTAYKKAYASQFDMVVNSFVMPALVSITMQKTLIKISSALVPWLVAIAFFLRVFMPTRQMGNMLIAVGLALYIVLPTMYAVNGAMDELIFKDCNSYRSLVADEVMGGITRSVTGTGPNQQVQPVVDASACTSNTSFWIIASSMPQAFFLPNLTLALVITFIAGINKALKTIG